MQLGDDYVQGPMLAAPVVLADFKMTVSGDLYGSDLLDRITEIVSVDGYMFGGTVHGRCVTGVLYDPIRCPNEASVMSKLRNLSVEIGGTIETVSLARQ